VKTVAKVLMALALVLVAFVIGVGPGSVVAGAEYPFGIGPWSATGRYCHVIDGLARFVDEWKFAGEPNLTTRQRATWLAFDTNLTSTGPPEPRADFTAWFRATGNTTTVKGETALINTWWNQNCTNPMMEVPASIGHVWSGIGSHATFVHYPKNTLHFEDVIKIIK
jgi:hypothetical protein